MLHITPSPLPPPLLTTNASPLLSQSFDAVTIVLEVRDTHIKERGESFREHKTDVLTSNMPERRILVALDGSEHAEYCLQWTIENVLKDNDYLICAHCPEPIPLTTGDSVAISKQFKVIEDGVQNLIAKFAEILKKSSIKGKVLRLTGKPKEAIIAASKEEKANIIVTGTRGLGVVGRTILGSVSDYVAHNSAIPVIIVRK